MGAMALIVAATREAAPPYRSAIRTQARSVRRTGCILLFLRPAAQAKGARQIDGKREHDGRAALACDVLQAAEVAKLHRLGPPGEYLARLGQPLGGLQLALSVDDLGATQPLGLGLLGDGAD